MTRRMRADILEGGEIAGWRRPVAERVAEPSTAADLGTSLVRLAQRGDADAFDALSRARIEPAYRLAFGILRSEEDARDAIQEAFVAAWRQLPALRDPARFDAWLGRIVVNACQMALRHRRVVRVREIVVTAIALSRLLDVHRGSVRPVSGLERAPDGSAVSRHFGP